MEKIDRSLKDLQTLMELQIQGMDTFQDTQMAVRGALEAKNWPLLERSLQSLDFQSEGLRCLEERRSALWQAIQFQLMGREARFYEALHHLPEAQREPMAQLFRDLKVRSLRLKGLSLGLAAYVQTAASLIQSVVQEINPALRGRLYSRNGFLRGAQTQPLVLNTHF